MTASWTANILNDPRFFGFDSMFDRIEKTLEHSHDNYPPHNVCKLSDDSYAVEMALAGLSQDDIEVTVEDDQLTIKGGKKNEDAQYIHHGIATRSFKKTFTLGEYMIVRDAEFTDGLLKVFVDRIVPEEKKQRKVEINGKKVGKKTLLNE
tara:strand:+ start:29505 stop:29954 length:450 start_codon:yes stop_codon:yes gene_type:complete